MSFNISFKEFLMEGTPSGIKKLVVFDFDDTLVFTPPPEEGIPNYEKATGKPWYIKDSETAKSHGFPEKFRRLGWWGRAETLHPPIFDPHPEKLNQSVAQAFHNFKKDANTYVVVMTGRIAASEKRVKEILAHYGIHADEYFFQGQKDLTQHPNYPRVRDTFAYKEFVIISRLMSPELQTVEIFDDREEHIPKFVELGKILKASWPNLENVVIHDVRQNKNYNL